MTLVLILGLKLPTFTIAEKIFTSIVKYQLNIIYELIIRIYSNYYHLNCNDLYVKYSDFKLSYFAGADKYFIEINKQKHFL